MRFIVNNENKIPKTGRTIMKCTDCGFKYYDSDIHVCGGKSVVEKTEEKEVINTEKEIKEKKETAKGRKESFKMWKDSEYN